MKICFNDEHPPKALCIILDTESGMVIFSNEEHPEKVHSSITEIESERIIRCNDEQSIKAEYPMLNTEFGMLILF